MAGTGSGWHRVHNKEGERNTGRFEACCLLFKQSRTPCPRKGPTHRMIALSTPFNLTWTIPYKYAISRVIPEHQIADNQQCQEGRLDEFSHLGVFLLPPLLMTQWDFDDEMAINAQSNTLDLRGKLGSQKPECAFLLRGWMKPKQGPHCHYYQGPGRILR